MSSNMPMLDRGIKPRFNQTVEITQNCSQCGMSEAVPESRGLASNRKGVKAEAEIGADSTHGLMQLQNIIPQFDTDRRSKVLCGVRIRCHR